MQKTTVKQPSKQVGTRTFTEEEIREAFQSFDLDKNMYIGPGEIRHILSLVGEQATNEEVEEMIRLADSDGSGFASFDGFHKLFAPVQHGEPVVQKPAATNSQQQVVVNNSKLSGSASIRDLMAQFCATQEITPNFIRIVYKRVQETDRSHSGRLGYREFLGVLRSEDSDLMKKLFDVFDVSLLNEIEVKHFLVSLILHSGSIKFAEKLKISFSMMRSPKSPPDSMDRNSLRELISTFFAGYRTNLASLTIDERVDKIFESARDGFITFNDFMDVADTAPELIIPPALRSETT